MLEKTFNPGQIEQIHYKKWEKAGIFSAHPESGKKPFTIMMPPPNVTGTLHMGHAFTMTLQDILTRFRRMQGFDALWQPGTDHAGIATQIVVEKKIEAEGQTRRDLGREKFVEKIWEWKEFSGGTITNQLRRLGASCDWSRERFTMDEGLNRAVRKVFVQLHREGLIYKDKRLVNWDPKLHTAISDLEVDNRETKGSMWYINYPVEGSEERFITIATTRPETMLGDTAIAVHPDDERYKDLIGKFAVLPIVERLIKIVADDYVDPEAGSGAMKITPAHDFNDFELGKRHGLEMISIFDENAALNAQAPEDYRGLDRYKAREKILKELEEQDLLVKIEPITNKVPYSERSNVVIEPYLTDQWYCDAPTLARPAIEAVESGRVKFVPANWDKTYFEWMRNIQPWCISRQLWWGHQIPAWYGPNNEIFVAETEDEAYADARLKHGDNVKLKRDDDVLDTWFSSALWPFSTLGWPDQTPEVAQYYPGDVLITGFDIIFFWVARMMMMGLHFMDAVPFHTIYMHALVRDAKGQKMSKSKGNIIDPLTIVDKYGADALRFTLTALASPGRDIKLSEERVEGYRNFGTKLWNAARYCEMNGCIPPEDFDAKAVNATVNRWIVAETTATAGDIAAALDAYRFNDAASAIYQFVWGTFCDWYIEFTKPLLVESNADTALKQETRDTTGWVLDQILLMLSPFMPFITEELYGSIAVRAQDGFLMTQSWPDHAMPAWGDDANREISWLIRAITEIRSVRSDMNVPPKAMLRLIVRDANATTLEWLKSQDEIIRRLARIDIVEISDDLPKGSIQTVIGEASFALPIADIIDLDKERARLKKDIEKLQSDLEKISQKLENKDFMSRASEEIVEEQKQRKITAETTLQKLTQAVVQLSVA